MIYAYDNWAQMPSVDLYDTLMMAMALNAAKDMYEKGEQRIKDFKKEYGDFMTPILADQNWYNQNVTGKINNRLNLIYARGGDPLRNALDRAEIQLLINSIDVGSIAKLRSSAENAREFLKERAKLEAAGLYNPLYAKYDGPDMRTYSTLDSGVWDKMSPTRITDVATFSNPYFEGLKPNIHKESKNGIDYSVEEINMGDLRRVADAHYNELVSTPQGQLMYKYYLDVAKQLGSSNVDEDARRMFNDAVADSQNRRIYKADDYKDNYFHHQQLENAREQLRIKREQLEVLRERNNLLANRGNGKSGSGGSNSNKELISYYQPLYQNLVVNTLNKDPMRLSVFSNDEFHTSMGSSILSAQRNIAELYFGSGIYGGKINTKLRRGFSGLGIANIDESFKRVHGLSTITQNTTVDASISSTKEFRQKFDKNYRDYLNLFSGGNKAGFSAMFADTWKHGLAKVDALSYAGKNVDKIKGLNFVAFDASDIDNVYSAKEIAARMAGITGPILDDAIQATQRIRKRLGEVGEIAMKATSPIGCGDRVTGQYGIYSNMKFKYFDGGDAKVIEDAVLRTPFMSTPNPNAAKDDNLNLTFDQDFDLERKIMDNAAVKSFGVSSNSGSTDATLPSPEVWYDSMPGDFESDFDFDF